MKKIFVSHSGGKDSQAMLAALVAAGHGPNIVIVHADLGDMEHEPMHDWIVQNSFGLPVHVVTPPRDFYQLARDYKRLPSGQARFCTSKLKTDPIRKWVTEYCRTHGITEAKIAIGLRREESATRAAKPEFSRVNALITDWHPILDLTEAQVFETIRAAGQAPHRVYSQGWSRLSCVMCVLGRKAEHLKARELYPEKFRKMAELEKELGKSIRLKQRNGIKLNSYLEEL